jgi:CobQ-like glutamine amidotransferase family enzyme
VVGCPRQFGRAVVGFTNHHPWTVAGPAGEAGLGLVEFGRTRLQCMALHRVVVKP